MDAAGKPRTNPGQRRRHTRVHVWCTADDAKMTGCAGVDVAQAQAVGIWMAFDLQHLRHVHVRESRIDVVDALDFESGHREAAANFVEVSLDRDEFLQPTKRQPHDEASLVARNWLRKRMSFS